MNAAQSMDRGVSLVLCVMCGAGAIVSPRAVGQCTLLVRESFRPGERPHGNNGRLRDAQIHDTLKDYWPQTPAGAMWIGSDVSGVPTWGFAGSSLDPAEVDPLDPFNGTAFGDASAAALLPFNRPSVPFTLAADVVMLYDSTTEARLGYTNSPALTNNFATNGALWISLNGRGEWQIRENGSNVVAAGTAPIWGELGGGWLHVELTLDPATSMVSGRVMSERIAPFHVPTVPASAYFAMEANQSWVVVNNLSITTGATLVSSVTGDGSVCPGAVLTLNSATNAAAPSVIRWSRDWMMIDDGVQTDGSVVSGSGTTTLTVTNAGTQTAGAYRMHVANECNTTYSEAHEVVVGGAACNACPCSADFDGSGGTPDASDIDAFFAAWLAGDASADADCSGGTPDASDVDGFFQSWLAGGC